jgi:hypothetical protein
VFRGSGAAGSGRGDAREDEGRRAASDSRSPVSRKGLGIGLAVGALLVVGYELFGLVSSLASAADGVERGATYTILLMILVTFLTVGGIGYGLFRAARRAEPPSNSSDDGP